MQPGSQERPEALEGVDLAEAIAVLPGRIRLDHDRRSCGRSRDQEAWRRCYTRQYRRSSLWLLDDRMDSRLLDIGQHPDHHLAAALDHAEDRWLLLLQGTATAAPFQSVAPAFAPLGPHRFGIALVPGDDVELVELDVAAQNHLGCLRHDAVAQHLGHGLDIALAQTQLVRDLTVRQVYPHEVRAQDPGRDGLMMSGKNGPRQVIEAILACLAQISLSVPLAIVMAVADHASVTTVKADNTFWPSELTNDFIALRLVEQGRQLDQVHHGFRSLPHRERPTDQRPDQNQHAEILPRADGSLPGQGLFITPEPDKSLK